MPPPPGRPCAPTGDWQPASDGNISKNSPTIFQFSDHHFSTLSNQIRYFFRGIKLVILFAILVSLAATFNITTIVIVF